LPGTRSQTAAAPQSAISTDPDPIGQGLAYRRVLATARSSDFGSIHASPFQHTTMPQACCAGRRPPRRPPAWRNGQSINEEISIPGLNSAIGYWSDIFMIRECSHLGQFWLHKELAEVLALRSPYFISSRLPRPLSCRSQRSQLEHQPARGMLHFPGSRPYFSLGSEQTNRPAGTDRKLSAFRSPCPACSGAGFSFFSLSYAQPPHCLNKKRCHSP